MNSNDLKFTRIRVIENSFELHQIEYLLKEADISYKVISYRDTAFGDLYKKAKGWGEVQVQEKQIPKAKQILEEKLSELADVPEKEVESQALSARA